MTPQPEWKNEPPSITPENTTGENLTIYRGVTNQYCATRYSYQQIQELVAAGSLRPEDFCRVDGRTNWEPISTVLKKGTPPSLESPIKPTEINLEWSLRTHIICAVAFFVMDALLLGGVVGYSLLVAFFSTIYVVCKALYRIILRRPIYKVSFIKIGIYWICVISVITTYYVNNQIARHRAETIIVAVKQYKAKYNHYPDKLRELVPEFLPSVPLAKYTLIANTYSYRRYRNRKNYDQDAPVGSGQRKFADPETRDKTDTGDEEPFLRYSGSAITGTYRFDFNGDKWEHFD